MDRSLRSTKDDRILLGCGSNAFFVIYSGPSTGKYSMQTYKTTNTDFHILYFHVCT